MPSVKNTQLSQGQWRLNHIAALTRNENSIETRRRFFGCSDWDSSATRVRRAGPGGQVQAVEADRARTAGHCLALGSRRPHFGDLHTVYTICADGTPADPTGTAQCEAQVAQSLAQQEEGTTRIPGLFASGGSICAKTAEVLK